MRFFSMLMMSAVTLLASVAQASPSCSPTATVGTRNYPGAASIPTTNNLMLPAGKAVAAKGQQVTIHGQVLDTQCMPVPGVIVELWQNSPTGRWLLAGREDLASAGPIFAGAGRTYTDNDGNFTFITAFPAPLNFQVRDSNHTLVNVYRAPTVNVKVTGSGIADLTTALFFSGDARNDKDMVYGKLGAKARGDTLIHMSQGEGDDIEGKVQLVIATKAPYRTY